MAKFEIPHEDTLKIFDGVIKNSELDRYINIKLLSDNRQKIITKVQKSSDLVKFETKNDLYITVNETIFEQLEDWQRVIVAEEAIAGIYYNTEKDKLEIKKGDVETFSGLLRKYGYERYEVVLESIKTLYSVEKQEAEV